ncbi:MAG: trigger factor [Desulfomonile tiedjei]|uniref:Trigger factor n=1 Tax=Desulfomonile tiedjei TaxID=2358 RepID=A0A9D6Z084_9BACT|nr:trigger factor [Desulfomonile tiedjei]
MTNIQIENVSEIKKKVTVQVPEEQVQSMLDTEYRDLKKTVQIKGFRKGKVPMNIIRSYFKDKVQADTIRKIIEETLQPGLDENKIVPVSVLSIDPETIEAGKPFQYTAEIEVPPPLDVEGYKGLNLKKYIREIDEKQVDERIQGLRERNARLAPIPESRGLVQGDHLVVDIKAESDGAPISALTVTDYHLEIGRNFYLPDFDKNLEGANVEETKSFALDLPESFPRKNLAGKSVSFEITVKEAKERILPALDDDFAKDLGEFETVEALKDEIRKDLTQIIENRSKKEMEEQIIDALLGKMSFEVPTTMIESQVDNLLNQTIQNLVAHGLDPRKLPAPSEAQRNQVRPSAERIVKTGLLLRSIGEKEAIEVSDEDLQAGIAERAEQIGMSADYLKDQLEANKMTEELRASLLQEKVFKFIQDHGEITEENPPEEANSQKEKEEE